MNTEKFAEVKKHPSIDEMIADAEGRSPKPPTGTSSNGPRSPRELYPSGSKSNEESEPTR